MLNEHTLYKNISVGLRIIMSNLKRHV